MTDLSGLGMSAGQLPSLAQQLDDVARLARHASTFAEGEYLPQMSRRDELVRSWGDAGRAASGLERLVPQIAALDGGQEGLRLAKHALEQIRDGRQSLDDGVAVAADELSGGVIVVDDRATHTAGQHFESAAEGVRGIADIARIEAMSGDELQRGLLSAS